MKIGKALRSVYDATSKSTSKVGRFGRFVFPYNGQYFIRDAWRKYGKSMFNSAGSISSYSAGGGDVYGPTGSIVGRY